MFDFIFGWRKAPKCKKLIRGVQCRLKLLKNKRRSIVRQLREDVALLLKHGHEQNAFDRVEQLFKDESIVAVFDLLDHFCEFIIIHLSYIRRHKDCPNDINEAVSTLIFASARCGDLPELPAIRRLFGERYGHRFAMVAVELLPGNLVNREIKENLSIASVPNDVKYRLLDEIARTCLQPAPLALEYYPLLQLDQHTKKSLGDQVLESDIFHGDNNRNEASPVQDFNIMEAEGMIVPVDYFSDSKQNLMDPCNSKPSSDSTGTSICSSTYEIRIPSQCAARTWTASGTRSHAPSGHKDVVMATESSSEGSSRLPEEPIYLDDIEEFKSPMSKDENSLDQRLFKFKSSVVLESSVQNDASWNENEGSRRPRKSRKASGKRQRRRSVSRESVKDAESTTYYGESCDKSPNDSYTTNHHRKKHQKKIPFDDCEKSHCAQARLGQICSVHAEKNSRMKSLCSISSNRRMVQDCSLENPCYFRICDDKDDMETQRRGMSALEGCPVHNLKDEKLRLGHCHYSEYPKNRKRGWEIVLQKPRGDYQTGDYVTYTENLPTGVIKKLGREEGVGYAQSCASSLCSSSSSSCSRATSPWKRKGMRPPYLRAMTMPTERPSDSIADNMLRSNSFPFQQPSHSSTGSPACRHVHPNLPDYDQLEATFMALKKANLQQKSNQSVY